jgi:hypothetical protein
MEGRWRMRWLVANSYDEWATGYGQSEEYDRLRVS